MISALDENLYEKILEIKGLYNSDAPLRRSSRVLDEIKNILNTFLD